MKQDLTLVLGATGLVSTEVIRTLKAKGEKVRSTTSQKGKTSAEVVFLDAATGEGLKDAFEGVSKAFLFSPPGFADQYAILAPLIQEAKRRGLKKVVLMTAMGANAVETAPLRKAELDLEKSGLTYNIVRPNWFMQNFNTFWIHGIKSQGKILLPAGDAKTSFIHSHDISDVVASLLTRDDLTNQAFDITGSEALNHAEVAAAISSAAGKKVVYQEISAEDFKSSLVSAGVPADFANFLGLIMGFLKEGYAARITDNVAKITGKTPRTFKQYAQESKYMF